MKSLIFILLLTFNSKASEKLENKTNIKLNKTEFINQFGDAIIVLDLDYIMMQEGMKLPEVVVENRDLYLQLAGSPRSKPCYIDKTKKNFYKLCREGLFCVRLPNSANPYRGICLDSDAVYPVEVK